MKTGQYFDLEARGFIKPEEGEPSIDGFEFYIDAFRELTTSRPGGLELQYIPFTAIAEYFKIYELTDFEEFSYIIRVMDRTFIDLNEAAQKLNRGNDAAKRTDKGNKGSS